MPDRTTSRRVLPRVGDSGSTPPLGQAALWVQVACIHGKQDRGQNERKEDRVQQDHSERQRYGHYRKHDSCNRCGPAPESPLGYLVYQKGVQDGKQAHEDARGPVKHIKRGRLLRCDKGVRVPRDIHESRKDCPSEKRVVVPVGQYLVIQGVQGLVYVDCLIVVPRRKSCRVPQVRICRKRQYCHKQEEWTVSRQAPRMKCDTSEARHGLSLPVIQITVWKEQGALRVDSKLASYDYLWTSLYKAAQNINKMRAVT